MIDPGFVPMSDPLAYFLTWTTYGTWLPGDERGWVKEHQGFQVPAWKIEHEARRKLTESPCTLDDDERALVEQTIRRHCEIRGWSLLAVACRTNHVHAIVAAGVDPDTVMNQLKAWCTRRLKERRATRGDGAVRENWWTEGGSKRFLNDTASLENAVNYVLEAQ
jgi:REP element-mobilizing transposase RayT